ncbi:MAG: DUF169 domain-containing protein [Acidimicrobiia bacterium]
MERNVTDWQSLSDEVTGLLGLEHAPVAVSFLEEEPVVLPRFDAPMSEPTLDGRTGRVPAGCVFWIHGHESSFVTLPEDHGNCSVGRYTHGLAPAEEIVDQADVATLLDAGWVTMEAFASVAKLSRRPAAIGYGPLAEAVAQPDLVLLRLDPRQMMELADAAPDVRYLGKPQCQILPVAAEEGVIAASMGCALSRARTGMGDGELTCAVPGHRMVELVERLRSVCRADQEVVGYAVEDRARFE